MANSRQQAAGSTGSKRRMRMYWAGVVIFGCWALYTLINQEISLKGESDRLSETKSEKLASEQQISSLQQEIEKLRDPEYIGQLAVKQGMVREGERIIEQAE